MVFITFGDYFRVSSPFRTHLVVLFTFYLGEGCHQLFLVWAFSSALTCVFSRFQAHKQHPQVEEEHPAWEAGPQPGAGPGAGSALGFVRFVQREREVTHPPQESPPTIGTLFLGRLGVGG